MAMRFRPELEDWIAGRDQFVVGIEDNLPPFSFADRKGEPDGYCADISMMIAELIDKDIVFFSAPIAELHRAVADGRVDFIVGLDKANKHFEDYEFTSRILVNEYILYVYENTPAPSSVTDLRGKKIGYRAGTPISILFNETPDLTGVPLDSDSLGLAKVALREIDGYIGSIYTCDYVIKLHKWDKLIDVSSNIIFKYDYSIAVPKESAQLFEILDAVITRLTGDREFRDIYAKWFGACVPTSDANQYLSWILLVVIIVSIFILLFFAYSKERAMTSLKLELRKSEVLRETLAEFEEINKTFFTSMTNAGIGVFILSDEGEREGRFIDANEGLADISGYDVATILEMDLTQLLAEHERERVIERYRLRRMGEPQPESYELEGLRADGRKVPIELFVKTVKTREKVLTIGIVRDISRLRILQEKLRNSDQNFRSLLSALPQGAIILNRERIIYVNHAFRQLVGKAPEEIRAFGISKLITPLHRAKVERLIDAMFSGKEAPKEMDFELIGPRNDAIQAFARPRLIDYFGEKAIVMVLENLTEEERIRKQLGIENRVEGLGKIAEHVVLEYNNMLMGILGAVGHIRGELPDDMPLIEYVNIIEKDAERAATLTKKLLNFSRDTEQRPGEVLSVNKVIKDALALSPGDDNPAIEVVTELEARPDTVFGNLSQVHQAVLNLLVNAVEAMKGGGTLTVRTSNAKPDSDFISKHPDAQGKRFVQIEIIDTGQGIPADLIDNVFEPFFTTKQFGAGAGLGLSLVFKVARRHGGIVEVESEPGKGSKFILYIPEEIAEATEVKHSEALPSGTETILVVDDEPHVRTVLRALLMKLGYEVLLASGGDEAIEIVRSRPNDIHLILLDVVMPGMSGVEVFEAVNKLAPDSKIIISTGYAKEETVSDLIRSGAEALVRKPYRAATISKVIREVLER